MAGRQKNAITLFMKVKGNKKVQATLRQAEAHIGKFGVKMAQLGVHGATMHSVFTKTTAGVKSFGLGLATATAKAATFGTAIAGVTAGVLTRMALKLADTAAEAGEVRSLFEQAFTGQALVEMDQHVRKLVTTLGLSKSELERNASLVAVFGQKAGLTGSDLSTFGKELLWVGADLTAAYGTSFEEAMTAIKSGLSGEIEPLKRFGVVMTEADLAARSAELGFTKAYKAMTVDEKILVRAAYIKESLGFASGQALREADNYATVMRSMDATFKTWQEQLGGPLLDPIKEIALAFRDMGEEWMPDITKALEDWIPPADQIGATVRGLLDQVSVFARATKDGGFADGIGAVFGPEAAQLYRDIERIFTGIGTVLGSITQGFIDVFTPFGDDAAKNSGPLLTKIADALDVVADHKDDIRAIAQETARMLPTILAVSGAFTAWGKTATFIGQAAGSVKALNTALGVAKGKAARQVHRSELLLGVRKARKNPLPVDTATAKKLAAGAKAKAAADVATGVAGVAPLAASKGIGAALKSGIAKPFQLLGKANPARLIGMAGNALRGLFVIIRANPIAALVTGLAALFVGMWNHSEKLRNTVTAAWDAIKVAGAALMEGLGQAFQWFQTNVGQPFAAWWETTGSPMVGAALGWLGDKFADILGAIGGTLTWLWEKVAKPALKWIAEVGFPAVASAITTAQAVAQTPINLIAGGIKGMWEAAQTGKSLVVGFFDGIKHAAYDTWVKVEPYVNGFLQFFGKEPIKISAPKPTVRTPPGARIADEPVQGRALGGPVGKARPYLVGERGPELFIPSTAGVILPHHKTRKLAEVGPGGVSVTIHNITIHGGRGGDDLDRLAVELADRIDHELARKRRIDQKVR